MGSARERQGVDLQMTLEMTADELRVAFHALRSYSAEYASLREQRVAEPLIGRVGEAWRQQRTLDRPGVPCTCLNGSLRCAVHPRATFKSMEEGDAA